MSIIFSNFIQGDILHPRSFSKNNFIFVVFLMMGLQSCSKDNLDPNLARLGDEELRKAISGKWEKESENGYEEMRFDMKTVEYVMNRKLGNQNYKRDGYDIVKSKNYLTVRFMKYGMVMQEEKITNLSNDTWTNAMDGHTYHKKP
jgi:hypothetical protein